MCTLIKKLYSENGRKCPLWANLSVDSSRSLRSGPAQTWPVDRAWSEVWLKTKAPDHGLASFENGAKYWPMPRFFWKCVGYLIFKKSISYSIRSITEEACAHGRPSCMERSPLEATKWHTMEGPDPRYPWDAMQPGPLEKDPWVARRVLYMHGR